MSTTLLQPRDRHQRGCVFSALGRITSGTVTLDTVAADVLTGMFEIMLDSGDHVTGSFHPSGCPAFENPPPPMTCM